MNRHKYCGRGNEADGPDNSDCEHRRTEDQYDCAAAGCGFCIASKCQMLVEAANYHRISGENATIEGCPCCFGEGLIGPRIEG